MAGVNIRTSERLEIDLRVPGHRSMRTVHVVELIIGGVVYRTEAASSAHAMELAIRTARELGIGV